VDIGYIEIDRIKVKVIMLMIRERGGERDSFKCFLLWNSMEGD
jgi:hypothetical protein